MKIALIILSVITVIFGFVITIMASKKRYNELKEQKEKEKQEVRKNEAEKNKIKESMESGNAKRDFDTSVDVLHKLANR